MILFALVVDSVKLGKSGFKAWDLAISEETPDLPQRHCERLFRFGSLDLPCIVVVPSFKFGVVAKHDILHLLCNVTRVLFKLREVRDVKQALEWVWLNFFLCSK